MCVCVQKLEDAAANAVEEERRRLETQNELEGRYRVDLEKEKMVEMSPKHSCLTSSHIAQSNQGLMAQWDLLELLCYLTFDLR